MKNSLRYLQIKLTLEINNDFFVYTHMQAETIHIRMKSRFRIPPQEYYFFFNREKMEYRVKHNKNTYVESDI